LSSYHPGIGRLIVALTDEGSDRIMMNIKEG